MADFNAKSNVDPKPSMVRAVFLTIFAKISKLYKTKADMCTKFVHAGLAIFLPMLKQHRCILEPHEVTILVNAVFSAKVVRAHG